MPFNRNNLIVEHGLERLGTVGMEDYVAHIICMRGRFDFTFDGNPFLLKSGEAMIVGIQQLLEKLQPSADLEAMCIYVKNDFLELCTPRSNYGMKGSLALYSCPVMQMDKDRFEQLRHDFVQIEQRLQNIDNPFQEDVLICATQMMFLDFFDIHAALNGMANISFQDTDIIARFMQMLERGDYVKNREVGYYADKLCVTPKYLSEVTKDVSGKTANYWILRFTIVHIRRLLKEREMTFTEISDLFDFSSPAYFSRFVQKHFGVSPTKFRE
ncbi:helix-turn-helix domain-containing protein [Prevotella falsenii]|uniref:helix-turn-helix domain-containing protein n=1 Tax=Prevotella falsenii TaxID=515414 RepID=UPI00046AB94D|nr:helix-turn-helix domain-containing protein [Prevotella falsenii]